MAVNPNKDMEEIISIMDKNGVSMIPVLEYDGRIIGICSRSKILIEVLNKRFLVIDRKKIATTTIGEG